MNKQDNATQQAAYQNDEGHKRKQEKDLPCTLEELQNLLQVEGDRRVSQALKTASEKWQKELLEKIEAEKCEAKMRAGLLQEKVEKEALERYAKELEHKERALKQKELELKIIYLLAQNKLPLELKDYIPNEDEETAMKMLETLIRLWCDNQVNCLSSHAVRGK